jgi:hypothetical protein
MKHSICPFFLLFVYLLLGSTSIQAAASLDLYGNFHTLGITVTLDPADDPEGDMAAQVEYRAGGSGTFRPGFPLSRVGNTRFIGSLFGLIPGTAYQVRVNFNDPGAGPLNGTTAIGTAATRSEPVFPSLSKSYYVSPAGSGNDCSSSLPCSLDHGLTLAQPGETIFLRSGEYFLGEMTLPRSGAPGAPILIQGFPGETAILDGGDPSPFSWTALGGGVYRTNVNGADPHLVLANGSRLYPYQRLEDLQNLIWGIPGFYAAGTTLYVRLANEADPNSVAMTVSRYNRAFEVQQNYIYFMNLTFRHYGRGSYAKALYFYDGSDNLVQGCTFAVNDLGIGLKYGSHRNLIQDNTFYDTIFDWPWEAVKGGSELETGGIRFYDPATGRGNVIRRNTFHDFFDGLGICPGGPSDLVNETDFYENRVYRVGDDGVETDGQCSNVRLWSNTFHDVLIGISLAPVYTGPVYALRNLIYRTGAGNSGYPGSPFKFNSGYGTSGPMYLFHNTADAVLPFTNGLEIKTPGTWTKLYARNNIWSATGYALYDYNTSQPLDWDYDNFWTSSGGNLIRWNNTLYANLPSFTAATGQEAHGLSFSPGFKDAGNGDYTLAPGSGLIDRGQLIPGINDGYLGLGPDLGAFETSPATIHPLRLPLIFRQ